MSLVDCPILVDMAKPGDIQHSPWVTLLMFILVKIVMVAMEVMVVIYSAGVYYVNPGGPLPPLSITKPSPANPPTLNNTIFVLVKILSIGVLVNSYPELVCCPHAVHKEGQGGRKWFGFKSNKDVFVLRCGYPPTWVAMHIGYVELCRVTWPEKVWHMITFRSSSIGS